MIYHLLRPFVRLATRQYFREIQFKGEPVIEKGPLLIAANHPNVVLDGLLILQLYERPIWFIAKGSIFRGRSINRLLEALHLIPVHRRQDNPDLMDKNQDSFRAVCDKLGKGAAILIFPEGRHSEGRRLGRVKTGTARMALQSAFESNFSKDIKIQPVGINYSDFHRFNSSVTVVVGEPISTSEFEKDFFDDATEATRKLTELVETKIRALTVEIALEEHLSLVEKIAKLYRSSGYGSDDHERMMVIAKSVERLGPRYPEQAKNIEKRLTFYLQLSSALKLDGSERLEMKHREFLLLAAFPLVLLGIFLCYLPYRVIGWLGKKATQDHDWQFGSWVFSFAFVLFPAWFLLLSLILGWATGSVLSACASFLLFLLSGYFTVKHMNRVLVLFFSTFWPGRKTPLDVLRAMRDDLITELEQLRRAT